MQASSSHNQHAGTSSSIDPLTLLAAATLMQSPAAPSPDSIVADVQKLAVANDNDERFNTLTQMLRTRNLTFAVEPFTLEKPAGGDPRTSGRNIVVTLGEG